MNIVYAPLQFERGASYEGSASSCATAKDGISEWQIQRTGDAQQQDRRDAPEPNPPSLVHTRKQHENVHARAFPELSAPTAKGFALAHRKTK